MKSTKLAVVNSYTLLKINLILNLDAHKVYAEVGE
jgi:hypothetical protein